MKNISTIFTYTMIFCFLFTAFFPGFVCELFNIVVFLGFMSIIVLLIQLCFWIARGDITPCDIDSNDCFFQLKELIIKDWRNILLQIVLLSSISLTIAQYVDKNDIKDLEITKTYIEKNVTQDSIVIFEKNGKTYKIFVEGGE